MGQKIDSVDDRTRNREDLTNILFHLTKPSQDYVYFGDEQDVSFKAIETLVKILKEGKLKGSNSLIKGKHRVVCFQEVPFKQVCKNIQYEKTFRSGQYISFLNDGYIPKSKIRYCGIGIGFHRKTLFSCGARPVWYMDYNRKREEIRKSRGSEELGEWKKKYYDDLWRIVDFDMEDENDTVDFTYEREWRILGNLDIRDLVSGCIIVIDNLISYDYFIEKISEEGMNKKELLEHVIIIEKKHPNNFWYIQNS